MEFKKIFKKDILPLPAVIIISKNLLDTIGELDKRKGLHLKGGIAYVVDDSLKFVNRYNLEILELMYIDINIEFVRTNY